MKKYFVFFLIVFFAINIFAQENSEFYWIELLDKNNNPYSVSNPEGFLSQRAIDRRQRQNIQIDETDLPVSPQYVQQIDALYNVTVLYTSKWLNGLVINCTDIESLNTIADLPFVSSIIKVKGQQLGIINKKLDIEIDSEELLPTPSKQSQYSPKDNAIDYGYGYNQAQMLNVPYLHNKGFKGSGVHIAIIDAGFKNLDIVPGFDSIRANGQILGTRDFVNPNSNIYNEHSHGMSVLSVIAANIPGQLTGVAPKASFWLIRSEDGNSESLLEECNWVVAAEFADSVGVDIINSSLGYTTFDDPSQNHVYAQLDGNTAIATRGANIAAQKGILVVNSAGNSGNELWRYLGVPADGTYVLTVGATDEYGEYAPFSSIGPAANGQIKPDVSAQGYLTYLIISDGQVARGSGTSFSSPIIAGMAACLWEINPNLTRQEIYDIIVQSSSQYSKPDNYIGYGIPDMSVAYELACRLTVGPDPEDPLQVFVQFAQQEVFIRCYTEEPGTGSIEIFDIAGRRLAHNFNLELNKGQNEFKVPIDVIQSSSSILIVRFSSGSKSKTVKAMSLRDR